MRIVYVSHLHPPEDAPLENIGGIQRVSEQLYQALNGRGDVEIIPFMLRTSWSGISVKVSRFLLRIIIELPHLVRQNRADVVLFTSMVTASTSYVLRKYITVPMVSINHGHDVTLNNPLYQRFVPKVFDRLDGIISVSSATRKASIDRGMHPEKGIALPNGFDPSDAIDLSQHGQSRRVISEEFGVSLENKTVLLTVGRQIKRKGHEWFIREVFPKVKNNVIYLIVGDGPEHQHLRKTVRERSLEDRILLLGKLPDDLLKKVYAASDLFIMPNIPVDGDMEGFGVVMLEANLAYTPAIASDLEGIRDVIEPGHNGYRIPHGKPQKFAEAIDRVIDNELPYLQFNSRKYVEENFNWQHIADRYVSFLNELKERHTMGRKVLQLN